MPGPTASWSITEVLLGFVTALRHAGVRADHRRVETMFRAVEALGAGDRDSVYWAGRLALCAEPDDLTRYDLAFRAYFSAGGNGSGRPPASGGGRDTRLVALFGSRGAVESGTEASTGAVRTEATGADLLRHRDVARLSEAERAEVRRLLALLRPAAAPRRSRRYRPAARGETDPPRTVRAMLRHGGEAALLAHRRRRLRARRLVLLVDVSGSMEPYADALLRLAHAAVRARPTSTEVFTVGTRLTRVTRTLRARDPDVALAGCGRAIPDWSGGTRLGETLRAFITRWGQRGTARQAVVVIASDGWERGDPALLGEQLGRLSRLAYRLVWVNPHRGRPGYQPLAGGMAAALPHLDDFVAGHSFDALSRLATVIARR